MHQNIALFDKLAIMHYFNTHIQFPMYGTILLVSFCYSVILFFSHSGIVQEVEWVLSEHGRVLMSSLISLLHHHPNDSITEQVEKGRSLMYVPILTVFLLVMVV